MQRHLSIRKINNPQLTTFETSLFKAPKPERRPGRYDGGPAGGGRGSIKTTRRDRSPRQVTAPFVTRTHEEVRWAAVKLSSNAKVTRPPPRGAATSWGHAESEIGNRPAARHTIVAGRGAPAHSPATSTTAPARWHDGPPPLDVLIGGSSGQ